jgi:hypothetical protein
MSRYFHPQPLEAQGVGCETIRKLLPEVARKTVPSRVPSHCYNRVFAATTSVSSR